MYRNYIKRILDIGVAIVVLIFSLPAWVIIAVIIKLESEGPVLFVQERTGIKGKGVLQMADELLRLKPQAPPTAVNTASDSSTASPVAGGFDGRNGPLCHGHHAGL